MNLTSLEKLARERVCLALDTDSVDQALDLAKRLSPSVSSFKIGLALHLQAGLENRNIIQEIAAIGGASFLDLKGHDTPNQMEKYARIATTPGISMFTIHLSNETAAKAAVEACSLQAQTLKIKKPLVIGVTELTSLDDQDLQTLGSKWTYEESIFYKTELALKYGLEGIVCSAKKAGELEKKFGSQLLYVTPGIKMGTLQNKGQKQLSEPDEAVRDCSRSLLIIGSAITKALNPEQQAYAALQQMAPYLKP